jgi:septal ring factor EnvC (AmiA/AmiB activator)
MQLVAEHDTTTLSEAKQALAASLRQLQDQTEEIQANEKRLASAKTEEQDLLVAAMDETEQVSKLGKVVALQRLLESRIAQGSQRLESLKGELQHAAEAAFGHFGNVLSELRDRRHAKHLDRLKEMVEPERWPYAEATAISFIRFASDLAPLDLLDNSADL